MCLFEKRNCAAWIRVWGAVRCEIESVDKTDCADDKLAVDPLVKLMYFSHADNETTP